MKIQKKTANEILDTIKYGDYIEDEKGNSGIVERIDRISCKVETHYYFKLREQKSTILILK
jgi:hypothetical protein